MSTSVLDQIVQSSRRALTKLQHHHNNHHHHHSHKKQQRSSIKKYSIQPINDHAALVMLAEDYLFGRNDKPCDQALAVELLHTAHDYAPAQAILGFCREFGLGAEQDFPAAANYYMAAATSSSILQPQESKELHLNYYLNNNSIDSSSSSRNNDNSSISGNGIITDGNSEINNKNKQECFYYEEDLRMLAILRLAFLRKYGRPGIKIDRSESEHWESLVQQDSNSNIAINWLKRAATEGQCAASQYCLGVCFHDGIGVPRNPHVAFGWYKKSAEQGNCRGQGILGYCYGEGFGIEKDQQMALRYYHLAASQGETVAIYNIG